MKHIILSHACKLCTQKAEETYNRPPFLSFKVTNCIGGPDRHRQRVETCLAPCLGYLTLAAGKEALWKSLNYQLLLKTRHSDPQVQEVTVVFLK